MFIFIYVCLFLFFGFSCMKFGWCSDVDSFSCFSMDDSFGRFEYSVVMMNREFGWSESVV
jgi:hypothetical protein